MLPFAFASEMKWTYALLVRSRPTKLLLLIPLAFFILIIKSVLGQRARPDLDQELELELDLPKATNQDLPTTTK
jgi:hypothetical protein